MIKQNVQACHKPKYAKSHNKTNNICNKLFKTFVSGGTTVNKRNYVHDEMKRQIQECL